MKLYKLFYSPALVMAVVIAFISLTIFNIYWLVSLALILFTIAGGSLALLFYTLWISAERCTRLLKAFELLMVSHVQYRLVERSRAVSGEIEYLIEECLEMPIGWNIWKRPTNVIYDTSVHEKAMIMYEQLIQERQLHLGNLRRHIKRVIRSTTD